MDTISRENNSMLPVAGVVVGVIGLLLGGIALVQISKVKQTVTDHQAKVDMVDGIKAAADQAQATADKAVKDNKTLFDSTQKAFETVGPELAKLREDVTKIQEAMKKPAPTGKGGGPVVAGPGEYVIKAGDTFSTIARAHGCKPGDIAAVNPGVDSGKLKVGQKIKLPAKAK